MKRNMFIQYTLGVCLILTNAEIASCFCTRPSHVTKPYVSQPRSRQYASKGFGGGGFGSSATKSKGSKTKIKKSEVKKLQQRILKKYGSDIAKGTQQRIEQTMKELPPHLQMATQLYQQLQRWDAYYSSLSILQQTNISPQEVDGARRAKEELERLYKEHNFDEDELHNVFQKATWDASADAKAVRSITGEMPKDISERVDRACQIIAEAVQNGDKKKGRCLDVGCGFGVLVPHLTQSGLQPSQINGVDLSPEMIRNAREQHRGVNFEAADFLNQHCISEKDELFHGIIFCAALHDMPNPFGCLQKASELLQPNGKIVIVHPQGASHVLGQVKSNPVMVKRGLPTADELVTFCDNSDSNLNLEIEPAEAGSDQDSKEGYLAVLSKN